MKKRSLFMAVLALSLASSSGAQSQTELPLQPILQEQIAPYWTAEGGWHTELQLRNNLASSSLTVYPALRTADGAETPLDPITVGSGDVQTVNITDALAKSAPSLIGQPNAYGSIVLRYQSLSIRNLFASVMVHDTGHPILYHLDASTEIKAPMSITREGIWWHPTAQTKDYLILTNQSNRSISGTMWLYDATGKSRSSPLVLGPRQTQRSSVRDLVEKAALEGSYGGIKIEMGGDGGALDSVHILYDETAGFFANMKMFEANPDVTMAERDYNGSGVWSTRAPMLALSTPDPALSLPAGVTLQPRLLIRNTQNHATQLKLSFHWYGSGNDGRYQLPPFSLKPNETRLIDVSSLQSNGSISDSANWAQVTLTTDGKPEEVMAVAASYDSTLRYGAQTPFSDQLSIGLEGTEWRVDPTHTTIMSIGNGGTKPVTAAFTILYEHGAKQYRVDKEIAPDDEYWVNFADLIHNQIPDKDGNVLPPDTISGTYRLQVISVPWQTSLYEGKVITDKTFGHATYGCPICCGYFPPTGITPNPTYGVVATASSVIIMARNTCTNSLEDIDDEYPRWWSDNASVFTLSPGSLTGVSVGSAGAHVSSTDFPKGGQGTDNAPFCPITTSVSGGTGKVAQAPTGMLFFSDLTTKSNACTVSSQNAVERIIQYQVVSPSGPAGSVPMQESFANLSSDTCSKPPPSPTICNSSGVSGEGIFTDFISNRACSPPDAATCGFSLNPDLWQYCKAGSPAVTLGTPTYGVLWQAVYVDGSTSSIKPSTPVPNQ